MEHVPTAVALIAVSTCGAVQEEVVMFRSELTAKELVQVCVDPAK